MELKTAQTLMLQLYEKQDKKRGAEGTFIWLIEEIGELSEALRKKDKENISEEIADVLAWLLSLGNVMGIDVSDSFKEKYDSICPSCHKKPCNCNK